MKSANRTHMGLVVLIVLSVAQGSWAQQANPNLTVADSLGWREIVTSYSNPVLLSPDKRSYLFALQQPDLPRNGSWIEFYVGRLTSLREARPLQIIRLFTRSKQEATALAANIQWTSDSRRITFLWDDGQLPVRVVSVDVQTHKLSAYTQNDAPIREYALDANGTKLYYSAEKRQATLKACNGNVAITDESIWSLLACNSAAHPDFDRLAYATFVRDLRTGAERKVSDPDMYWGASPEQLVPSPNGRFALAVQPSPTAPGEWDAYTSHLLKDSYLPAARLSPKGPHLLRQFVLIDSKPATSRPLWNAPQNPYANVVWSPDSNSIVLGPTFLPVPTSNVDGLTGNAVAIIDVKTGAFTTLPLPRKDMPVRGYAPVRWTKEGLIELADAKEYRPASGALRYRKEQSGWHLVDASGEAPTRSIKIEVRQDYNTPPTFFAVDEKNGRERKIFESNPGFTARFKLAHAELIHWTATDGRSWSGVLYYPPGYDEGRACPLVIQTHGYLKDKFSLSGGYTTAFAAQQLATSGIAVVQLGGPDEYDPTTTATPHEPEITMRGVEGLIEHLSTEGLIDEKRVGIIGFSRTGWHVEYILTHSKARFAVAEIADSMDASYLEYVLGGAQYQSEIEQDVGAPPVGEGLQVWFKKAPVFNIQSITAPLRIELDSSPLALVLLHWDLFTMLKRRNKPVEYFIVPDVQHGTHILQNPVQRLASQGGTVDWFRFWLNGDEDPDPAKAEQYKRWRELRKLHEQNQGGPAAN